MDVHQLLRRSAEAEAKEKAHALKFAPPTKIAKPEQRRESREPPKVPAQLSIDDMMQRRETFRAAAQRASASAAPQGYIAPKAITSHVTEEMLKDYQFELNNPVNIDGRQYKYLPATSDIDLEQSQLHVLMTQDEIATTRQALRAIGDEFGLLAGREKQLEIRLKEIEILFDRRIGGIRAETGLAIETGSDPGPEYLAANVKIGRETKAFEAARKELRDQLRETTVRRDALEMRYDELDANLSEQPQKEADNRSELERVERINATKLQARVDEIKRLNQLTIDRQPGEGDEAFAARLQALNAIPFNDASRIQAAIRHNTDKFKDAFKEYPPAKIGTVVKLLIERDELYPAVKALPAVKKEVQKTFSRTQVNALEMADLISRKLREVYKTDLLPAQAIEVPQENLLGEFLVPQEQWNPFGPGYEAYPLAEPAERFAEREAPEEPRRAPVPIPQTARPIGYDLPRVPVRTAKELEAAIAKNAAATIQRDIYTEQQRREQRGMEEEDVPAPAIALEERLELAAPPAFPEPVDMSGWKRPRVIQFVIDNDLTDQIREWGRYSADRPAGGYGVAALKQRLTEIGYNKQTGSGLRTKGLVKLGDVAVNAAKLHKSNILTIQRHDGVHITGLPNTKVGDAMVELVLKLLKGGSPTKKDFAGVSPKERELYDQLIHMAGLHRTHENTLEQTKESLKHRMQLIEGEIGAGNTNPELKREAHSLLHRLAVGGMITYPAAKAHFKHLSSFF
jgi:hypothetical protein